MGPSRKSANVPLHNEGNKKIPASTCPPWVVIFYMGVWDLHLFINDPIFVWVLLWMIAPSFSVTNNHFKIHNISHLAKLAKTQQ